VQQPPRQTWLAEASRKAANSLAAPSAMLSNKAKRSREGGRDVVSTNRFRHSRLGLLVCCVLGYLFRKLRLSDHQLVHERARTSFADEAGGA